MLATSAPKADTPRRAAAIASPGWPAPEAAEAEAATCARAWRTAGVAGLRCSRASRCTRASASRTSAPAKAPAADLARPGDFGIARGERIAGELVYALIKPRQSRCRRIETRDRPGRGAAALTGGGKRTDRLCQGIASGRLDRHVRGRFTRFRADNTVEYRTGFLRRNLLVLQFGVDLRTPVLHPVPAAAPGEREHCRHAGDQRRLARSSWHGRGSGALWRNRRLRGGRRLRLGGFFPGRRNRRRCHGRRFLRGETFDRRQRRHQFFRPGRIGIVTGAFELYFARVFRHGCFDFPVGLEPGRGRRNRQNLDRRGDHGRELGAVVVVRIGSVCFFGSALVKQLEP